MKMIKMTETERQDCIRRFVDQELFACQSMLVDEAIRREFFSWDDVENLYKPFDGKLISPNACEDCGQPAECLDSETGECKKCFEDNQQAQDIYEWWLVSDWLEQKLKDQGEPILNNEYGSWWGRTCTGQAIYMDGVIQTVYDETMS